LAHTPRHGTTQHSVERRTFVVDGVRKLSAHGSSDDEVGAGSCNEHGEQERSLDRANVGHRHGRQLEDSLDRTAEQDDEGEDEEVGLQLEPGVDPLADELLRRPLITGWQVALVATA